MVASSDMEFFARCAGGFEDVIDGELRSLRARRVRPQVGGVIFFGTLADAYRACLWLRCATRVQLVLARVSSLDADALYQGVYDLPWEKHIRPGATIAVDAHGENPELRNTKFVALKVKDAVCDRMREMTGTRPDVDAKDPDFAINVAVHPKKATIYLNLSGASLHRRGYRQDGVQTQAPLKETLAAGILLAAGWQEIADDGGYFADPMCGSGTFGIEAAMMAAHVAPGLLRKRWGFEGWQGHRPDLWEKTRAAAQAQDSIPQDARVLCGDLDAAAIDIARANASRAGVDGLMAFAVADAARLGKSLRRLGRIDGAGGLLACNPPYGQRLLSHEELPQVNAALSTAAQAVPHDWRLALVTPDTGLDSALGRVPQTIIECHNGPIRVWVRLYEAGERRQTISVVSLGGTQVQVPVAEPHSEQFAARLRKVARERARWARKAQVSCYRVYDADLPDYAVTVDLYQGAADDEGQRYCVVEERQRPGSIDLQRASRRFADAVAIASAVLDVPLSHMVDRPWRDRRDDASATERAAHVPLVVCEDGCLFSVDLGRQQTGLPLAQRSVRKLVGSMSRDARVAGLFATSGAALVHAAKNGAATVTGVDGSSEWAQGMRRALLGNGFAGKAHQVACADVREWLGREARAHRTYDLLVCLAPSWLPQRDTGGAEWDLVRDHFPLLADAARVLAPGGQIVFAYDDQGLRLDFDALQSAGLMVENASGRVVPHDFERSHASPRCFVLRKQIS